MPITTTTTLAPPPLSHSSTTPFTAPPTSTPQPPPPPCHRRRRRSPPPPETRHPSDRARAASPTVSAALGLLLRGARPADVARQLRVGASTVYRWERNVRKHGSVFVSRSGTAFRTGRPPALTRADEEALRAWLLAGSAAGRGRAGRGMDVGTQEEALAAVTTTTTAAAAATGDGARSFAEIRTWCELERGVSVSTATIRRYVRKNGWDEMGLVHIEGT
jgi:transposase